MGVECPADLKNPKGNTDKNLCLGHRSSTLILSRSCIGWRGFAVWVECPRHFQVAFLNWDRVPARIEVLAPKFLGGERLPDGLLVIFDR